jgi:hypothetical protein
MNVYRTLCAAAMLAAVPFATSAQEPLRITLGTGAGASIPIGDFGDRADLGWTAQGNVGFGKASWPVGLRFDLMYHALDGADLAVGEAQDVTILAGLANVEIGLSRNESGGGLFAVGGGGFYRMDFGDQLIGEQESTELGIFGGLAYKLAMTNLVLSIEGKYHNIFTEGSSSSLIPLTIVAQIPISGN